MSQQPGHGFARDWEGSPLKRREFLAGAAMLGLSAGLTACGSSSSSRSATSAAALDRTAALRFSMSSTIPGLDPQKWWNGAAACGQCVIYESLLTIDPYSGKLMPLLASGLPAMSNGGTRYTFKLRPGLKFTNGTPLTSADVKYSFERLLIPSFGAEAGSLYAALPITGIAAVLNQKSKTLTGITTPDPQTVVFDFDHPDSTFVYLIALPMAGVVSQKAAGVDGVQGLQLVADRDRAVHRRRHQSREPHRPEPQQVLLESRGPGYARSTGAWASMTRWRCCESRADRTT